MGMMQGVFYSESLRMATSLRVIFPEVSNDVTPAVEGEPSVLYLLHGLSGNSDEWCRFSKIEYYAKKYNLIVIMPEVQRSFYTDTSYGARYFTYVADELPRICEKWFRIPAAREKTFIAGESMGGYGAVKIGLSRPERFGAVASLSGVLDYLSFAGEIRADRWEDMGSEEMLALHGPDGIPDASCDPIALVRREAADPCRPRLFQFCGTEDFLYEANLRFRDAAEEAGYGASYLEGPGDHDWPTWDKAVQRAIQFFLGFDPGTTPLY